MRKGLAAVLVVFAGTGGASAGQAQEQPDLSREVAVAARVLASEPMRAALDYVDRSRDETVGEWLRLCNTNGPSGAELYRSREIYRAFRIYGLERVHIDDVGNVIGVRPGVGDGPTVVLNAHHDNVALWPQDQPQNAFVADDRVWCPGAGDDLIGVTQLLTILRAMNAGGVETQGDVWFTSYVGEEGPSGPQHPDASRGARHFVIANVPHNIDWRRGDIIVQLHGGGGEGVSTGSSPARHRSQLRVFVPLDRSRWGPHAIDALGMLIDRLRALRDPRVSNAGSSEQHPGLGESDDLLYFNMPMVSASEIINAPAREVWIRFDLRSPTVARLWRAHEDIQAIARDVLAELGEGFSFSYEINSRNGLGVDQDDPRYADWDKVDNAPARMVAATAKALYGVEPEINPHSGCGDCVRGYREGMPTFSFQGNVADHLDGSFDIGGPQPLKSEVRRKTSGHDVTESAPIERLWAGIKHGLLFAITYTGEGR